jgi:hypothetical protein
MNRNLFLFSGSLIAISLSLLMSSYKKNTTDYKLPPFSLLKKENQNADTLVHKSLNGIDTEKAAVMINYFVNNKRKDFRPTRRSVWFDSATIRRMYDLLQSERSQEHPGPHGIGFTDGIRIYFACDSTTENGHLKNSIIVVSTKISGKDSSVPSGHTHKDYYYHSEKSALFDSTNLTATAGSVKQRQWINTRGENLYNLYYSSDDYSCPGDRHYIARRKAKIMVDQFGLDSLKANDIIATTSEWFDFELLQAFVNDTHPHDGLRIYFARHPDSYNNVKDTDRYKDAFILIPTQHAKFLFWGYHKDYFDCRSTESYILGNAKLIAWNKFRKFIDGGGDDNGEICPTHCP